MNLKIAAGIVIVIGMVLMQGIMTPRAFLGVAVMLLGLALAVYDDKKQKKC